MRKLRADAQSILRSGMSYAEQTFQLRIFRPLLAQGCDAPAAVSASSNGSRRTLRSGQSHAYDEQGTQRPGIPHGSCFVRLIGLALLLSWSCGMRNALRLIGLALLALSAFAGAAHASFPAQKEYTYHTGSVPLGWFKTDVEVPPAFAARCSSTFKPYYGWATVTGCSVVEVLPANAFHNLQFRIGISGTYLSGAFAYDQDSPGIGFRNVDWRLACPANSTLISGLNQCVCNSQNGYQEDATHSSCIQAAPQPNNMCKIPEGLVQGQPILPATAEKYRSETDWSDAGPGALFFTRTYRSNWAGDSTRASNPLGQVWLLISMES